MNNFIWNEITLNQPPLLTLSVKKLDVDLISLKNIFKTSIEYYECQIQFEESAALCSRLIARRKNSFKKMKGFQSMVQANSSLCRLLKIDILTVLRNFSGILPELSNTLELPTRANFDYVLLKMIAYYKLLERITVLAKESVEYFTKILHNSFFIDTLTLFLSVLSNIWSNANHIAKFTSKFYKKMFIYRNFLPKSKSSVLLDEFQFPEKLDLEDTNNESEGEMKNVKKENISSVQMVKNNEDKLKKPISFVTKNYESNSSVMDIGLAISRDSLKPKFDIKNIRSVEEIRKFFEEEEKNRKTSRKKSMTKDISNEEWIKFKKKILNKINANDNRNAIKTFNKIFNKNQL